MSLCLKLADPSYIEPQWYSEFVNHMERGVRKSTASMVAVMDFRHLAMSLCDLGPSTLNSDTLRDIPARFPNLRCLLLDENSSLSPSMLARNRVLSQHPHTSFETLHLLSLAKCELPLPAKLFAENWMMGLVYLDLSFTPGSLQSQIDQKSLKVSNLPQLRILKLRCKGLDNSTGSAVIREFRTRLWSLDVTGNLLGDNFLDDLTEFSLPRYTNIKLQTDGHFEAEGRIRPIANSRGYPNGRFYCIEESAWSATFSCPERYLADTPIYRPEDTDSVNNDRTLTLQTRSNGRGRPRGDSVSDAVRVLAGGPGEEIPDSPHLLYSPHWPSPRVGITHLHLNNLLVSASAVKRLLQHSPGFIEHIECDRPICLFQSSILANKTPWLNKSTTLYGFPGGAYLFRPVISSNLRVLKTHHSLVTNTPTVVSHGTDVLPQFWLAETCLRERMDLAYPQTYVPDMNPRLYSITLSMIPRYSTGAATDRLIDFLKLAARQEQMIKKVKAITPPRGPPVLEGLRHIRLEFLPDVEDEIASLEDEADELDPGALLSQGEEAFSFFSESAWDPSSSPAKGKAKEEEQQEQQQQQSSVASTTAKPQPEDPEEAENHAAGGTPVLEKLDCDPFNQAEGEHINITIKAAGGPGPLTVPVWVGPGVIDPAGPPAVNEYMRNLCDPANARDVTPATPCHVAAGVPAGSFIYQRAWDAMLLPPAAVEGQIGRPPGRTALKGLRDVLGELKAFRVRAARGYAEVEARWRDGGEVAVGEFHECWMGTLEVVLPPGRAQSSEYWR